MEALFESKLGDEWVALDPPVLNRERPPSLRLRVAHVGDAGHLKLTPADFRLSAGWLDLDYSSLGDRALQPGDALHFPVKKLKVPGPEDLPHEFRVTLGQTEVRASAPLTFVPAPEFALELSSAEVVLDSDSRPQVEGWVTLRRGRVWLESPPELDAPWARLVPLTEGKTETELDSLESPRYGFRFDFSPDELSLLRQRSVDAAGARGGQALERRGTLRFRYTDRGQKSSSGYREALTAELPVALSFILAPELYLEPFGAESRLDWTALQGLGSTPPFRLTLGNGAPGSGARQTLKVQALKVRELDGRGEWHVESDTPPPWTLPAGGRLELTLPLPAGWHGNEARLELTAVCNDPVQRSFHLRCVARPAAAWPGYLAIDLGTTSTCAALTDAYKQVQRLPLDGAGEMASAACYLRLVARRELEVGDRALRRALDPRAQRSVITQAKRHLGEARPFEIVPLDEPSETVQLDARQALSHLFRCVLDEALATLKSSGSAEVLPERLLVTHPSRFSLRQVQLLKEAADEARREAWHDWVGGSSERILPSVQTLHEPVGAAFAFLRDWTNLDRLHAEAAHWKGHLLVYDLGGGTLDVTLLSLESTAQALPEGGRSFTVSPRVLGSTGERWFGGADVTRALLELTVARLESAVPADLHFPESKPAERVAWQRNRNLLLFWCEAQKLRLANGGEAAAGWSTLPALSLLTAEGRERLVTASSWSATVELPSLNELEAAVEPQVAASGERVQALLQRHALEAPDVVLRVGKASQLPLIGRALAAWYPRALQVTPGELKGCVVEGACLPPLPGLASGVQLTRAARRPGVRFRWNAADSYTSTTCRLGLQVLDSGATYFQEVLPEGAPVPAGGLTGELDGLLMTAGEHTLTLLEHAGHDDRLVVDGRPNPDVAELAQCTFTMPQLDAEAEEQVRLQFLLEPDWSLRVRLDAPGWEGAEIARIEGAHWGGRT